MTKKKSNSDGYSDRNEHFFDKHDDECLDQIFARVKNDYRGRHYRGRCTQNRSFTVIEAATKKNWDECCKYKQPVTVEQIQERLFADPNEDWVKKCLRGNYEECSEEYSEKNVTSRGDAMRKLIARIGWFADWDEEKVIDVLSKNPIYDNWNGTDDYIRRKVSENENDDYYSIYE